MRKVELSLKEKQKYDVIKKLVETNGNKERARIKLGLKSIRQINRLIAGYKEYGKEFFVHGNRGKKPKHALTDEFKDEIEALRIIYNNEGEPLTYATLKDLENKLKTENNKFNPHLLWNTYSIIKPNAVKKFSTLEEKQAITNIIQLVRFAYHQINMLDTLSSTAIQYFNLWCGQIHRNISEQQANLIKQVVAYIVSNGTCTINDIKEWDISYAAQLIRSFGNFETADESIKSLSQFLIYRKSS